MQDKKQQGLLRRSFIILGGFMDNTKEILDLYQKIEKHIRFLESNIISEEEQDD